MARVAAPAIAISVQQTRLVALVLTRPRRYALVAVLPLRAVGTLTAATVTRATSFVRTARHTAVPRRGGFVAVATAGTLLAGVATTVRKEAARVIRAEWRATTPRGFNRASSTQTSPVMLQSPADYATAAIIAAVFSVAIWCTSDTKIILADVTSTSTPLIAIGVASTGL